MFDEATFRKILVQSLGSSNDYDIYFYGNNADLDENNIGEYVD